MAYAEKYNLSFKTHQGQDCTVKFLFEGYGGSPITLLGGDKPFVLSEFNTDENIFKPLRPQMATIQIITNNTGISIDDFLADNDTDIQVTFSFGTYTNFWYGYVLQDEFQEIWQNTNHIITIRATEGLGLLKNKSLNDSGNEMIGLYTPLNILDIASSNSVQSFLKYTCISNLFHNSMNDADTYTGLDQCYIDAKTFQKQVTEYDDCYTVIEKINKSWNQTMFMYNGHWFILRIEELWTNLTNNLRGFYKNITTRTLVNRRYDIEVGNKKDVKLVDPQAIRFINRKTKTDQIQFNYEQFNEVVCNESFSRGSKYASSSVLNAYNLDYWTKETSPISSPTIPANNNYGRYEEFDTNGKLLDNYAFCEGNPPYLDATWMRSCDIYVRKDDVFNMSFNIRNTSSHSSFYTTICVAIVQLYVGSNKYYLDKNGNWKLTTSWGSMSILDQCVMTYSTSFLYTDWQSYETTSKSIPDDGKINILLYNYMANDPNTVHFKGLKINIINSFNGVINRGIIGINSKFEKSVTLSNDFNDTISIDDNFSKVYKGSIYESNGTTLTDMKWHRYKYSTEEFGFRHHNDIAHWEHNKSNRNKLDCNFYGLMFNNKTEPIGLMNTIKFVDDDPNRIYYIANLKEIDFLNSTWSATIEEVYNSDIDNDTSPITYDTYSDNYIYQ